MSRNPNVYVSSVDTGLDRVLSENYSLILDKPTAEYLANKHCELTVKYTCIRSANKILISRVYVIRTLLRKYDILLSNGHILK